MNWKKRLITYAALSAVAVVAVLIALSLGTDPGTAGSAARLMNASNGREERKTYYIYCQEKKERQAAEGKSPIKSAMLLVGLICLLLSAVFAALFYRLR